MSESRRTVSLLVGALTLSAGAAVGVVVLGGGALNRGLVQLCVAPFFVLLFSSLRFNGVRMPRVLTGFAVIGVLTGAVARYSDGEDSPGSVVIARLSSDSLGSNAQVIKDNISRFVDRDGVLRIERADRIINSQAEAREFLQSRPNLGGVLWGSVRWLNVTLQPSSPVSLSQLPDDSVGLAVMREFGLQDLQLITGVPEFGLSMGLNAATLEFIGRLLPYVRDSSERLNAITEDSLFEQGLRMASSAKADWTSSGHRAIPMSLTGTYHLLRAISGDSLQEGELACAEISFRMAKAQIPGKDNPEFMGLIYNNEAVVEFFRRAAAGDAQAAREGLRTGVRRALEMRAHKNASVSAGDFWAPVVANVESVRLGTE